MFMPKSKRKSYWIVAIICMAMALLFAVGDIQTGVPGLMTDGFKTFMSVMLAFPIGIMGVDYIARKFMLKAEAEAMVMSVANNTISIQRLDRKKVFVQQGAFSNGDDTFADTDIFTETANLAIKKAMNGSKGKRSFFAMSPVIFLQVEPGMKAFDKRIVKECLVEAGAMQVIDQGKPLTMKEVKDYFATHPLAEG